MPRSGREDPQGSRHDFDLERKKPDAFAVCVGDHAIRLDRHVLRSTDRDPRIGHMRALEYSREDAEESGA